MGLTNNITGVCYDKKNRLYKAYVDIGGYKIRLGNFKTEQEAIIKTELKRKEFYDNDGFYNLESLYSLTDLYNFYLAWSNLKDSNMSFRSFIITNFQQRKSIENPVPLPTDLNQIQVLYLNGNKMNGIAKKLNLPIRFIQKQIKNL